MKENGHRLKVCHIVPDLGIGGAERIITQLSAQQALLGLDVSVVVLRARRGSHFEETLTTTSVDVHYLENRPGLSLSGLSHLRRIVATLAPDIIHSHRYAIRDTFLSGIWRRRRWLHTVHNIATEELQPYDRVVARFAYLTGACTPVAVSRSVRDSLTRAYGVREVDIVANGVALEEYLAISRDSLDHAQIRILTVGRLQPQKDQNSLLYAVAALKTRGLSFMFEIVGEGVLHDALIETARELGLESDICITPPVSDLVPTYRSADIFVLSSRYEGLPMTLLEAMASGLPCVATSVGGIPEVVADGDNGMLVPSSHVEALTDALYALGTSGDLRNRLGASGRETVVSRYSVERMASDYLSLYRNART